LQHKLKKSEINVRREYEPELPSVDGRGSELNQVWTNLIDNAIDALMDKAEAEKTLWIRAYRQGDAAVVEVEDNGPGIPAEAQDRIFTAFFTTKPPGKGTGLGLPISYNIVVDKHDGDIRVESAPGRTLFRVYLPINEECVLPPRSA
ncbi:MAG: sensor histidine kinase, partial [Candidatus Promineifilaceae bacterium]